MPINSKHIMTDNEVGKKIASIENANERKVAEFLLKLGLDFVDCNLKIGELQHQLFGEIDSLYKFQNHLFLIEVSKKKGANEKRFAFFTKYADIDVIKLITKKYNLRPKKIIRVYFEMQAKRPEKYESLFLKTMTKKDKWNRVLYSERFDHFEISLQNNIDDTREEFLKELGLTEQKSLKTVFKKRFKSSK